MYDCIISSQNTELQHCIVTEPELEKKQSCVLLGKKVRKVDSSRLLEYIRVEVVC